jgi:hypothetical protein
MTSLTMVISDMYIYMYKYRRGSVSEWYGAFPDCGPLAEDSATKLKGCQLKVCFVYGALFSPVVAEIFARLAGNFCQ